MSRPTQAAPGAVDVAALAEAARAQGRLGIDTEFMPEGRYRPLLCLVQVAVEGQVEVLDPLAGFDHEPLADVLADPGVEIVLHAGRQDVAILRRAWRTDITNVFDTQVAAGFAGYAAQAGYLGLIHEVLGIRLAKTASFTRWDVRPLTPEQLAYARDDVVHLLTLADDLQRRLRAADAGPAHPEGRLEWAREECRAVAEASDERDPWEVWRRLPRSTGLSARERAVARELAAWREGTAEREDKPVGSIVKDPTLVELAKRQPRSREALSQIRGLPPDVVRRRGHDILAVVERGRHAEPIRLEPHERVSTQPEDGPVLALAESLVRARSLAAGLAYELIAARADLVPIVTAVRREGREPDVRTLRGWRRELVGEELVELLRGRRALVVGPRGRVRVEPRDDARAADGAVSAPAAEPGPDTPT